MDILKGELNFMKDEEVRKLAHELTMEYIKHSNTIWQATVDNLDKITSHYEKAYKKFYELIVKTDL